MIDQLQYNTEREHLIIPEYGRHMQKMIGMEILKNLKYEKSNDKYEDGNILDPENGRVYNCKLWIENGKLKVRGYIFFLYRTQIWYPYVS